MGNGFRLLVVEDDPLLCEALAEILRFSGYEVQTARDGESALATLRGAPRPHAIVLDLVLPGMSSTGFLDALDRALRPRPPMVLMTGMVLQGDDGQPRDDLLLKPFDVEDLLARVAHACGLIEGEPRHAAAG